MVGCICGKGTDTGRRLIYRKPAKCWLNTREHDERDAIASKRQMAGGR